MDYSALSGHYQRLISASEQLTDTERQFKELSLAMPDLCFHLPHELPYAEPFIRQIVSETTLPADDAHFKGFLKTSTFLKADEDIAILRHLRYLPAAWHSHEFIEVACVISGTCTNYFEDQAMVLYPGDICIISPDTPHTVSAFSNDAVIYNIIIRSGTFQKTFPRLFDENTVLSDFFQRALRRSDVSPYILLHAENDIPLFGWLSLALEEYESARPYCQWAVNSYINCFFIRLMRFHELSASVSENRQDYPEGDIIYISRYMKAHFTNLTLRELAAYFNYSERQMQRILKTCTGKSFTENIQELRMAQAARLLRTTDRPIGNILREMGYSDAGYFKEIFARYYHMTPQEYRLLKEEIQE